jgi:hypothetical protein
MVGGPRWEAALRTDIVTADEQDLSAHDPRLIRDRAALGRALLAGGEIGASIETLAQAVGAASAELGTTHPDTRVYRTALVETCEVAEARGKKRDLVAAAAARRLLSGEDAPTST